MKVTEEDLKAMGLDDAIVVTVSDKTARVSESADNHEPLLSEQKPGLLPRIVHRLLTIPGFSPLALALTTALLMICLALGAWLAAMFAQNRFLNAQLHDKTQEAASEQSEDSAALRTRLEETQRQLLEIRGQIEKQNTDQQQSSKDLMALESATLRGELDTLSKPQLNAPLMAIEPASALMLADPTRKDTLTPVDVPSTVSLFTLILRLPPDKVQENYLVELLEYKSGKALWSEKQVQKIPLPQFTLTLAKRNVQAGKYRVRISGLKGKKKEVVDHYDVQVNYLSPPRPSPKKK